MPWHASIEPVTLIHERDIVYSRSHSLRNPELSQHTFRLPPVMVTLTKRRVYFRRFMARPLGSFFFSCGSTCNHKKIHQHNLSPSNLITRNNPSIQGFSILYSFFPPSLILSIGGALPSSHCTSHQPRKTYPPKSIKKEKGKPTLGVADLTLPARARDP